MTIDNDVQKTISHCVSTDLNTELELCISQKYLTSQPQPCLRLPEKTVNHLINYQML